MRSIGDLPLRSRSLFVLSALLALPGCVETPENGDVFSGATQGKVLAFSGKHVQANKPIQIQIMKTPAELVADPGRSPHAS